MKFRLHAPGRGTALGIALALLAFVAASAVRAPAQGQAPMGPMKVRLAFQPISLGPLWGAKAAGAFERAGLDVQYLKFMAGPPQFDALQGGGLELGWGGVGPFLSAYANGLKVRWIVTLASYNRLEGIVLPPGSEIKEVRDLRGKKVGYVAGSEVEPPLSDLLREAGVDLKEVQLVSMPGPQQVAALLSRSLDAAAVWSPFTNQVIERGGRMLLTFGDRGIAYLGFAARTDWYEQSFEAAVRLMQGLDEGYRYAQAHPDLTLKTIVQMTGMQEPLAKHLFDNIELFTLAQNVDLNSPVHPAPDSRLVRAAQRMLALGVSRGTIKAAPDPMTFFDVRAVQDYLKRKKK